MDFQELGKTIRPPNFPEGTPLKEMIAALERQLVEYRTEKAERMAVVEELQEQVKKHWPVANLR